MKWVKKTFWIEIIEIHIPELALEMQLLRKILGRDGHQGD